jgi:hypothetical protein
MESTVVEESKMRVSPSPAQLTVYRHQAFAAEAKPSLDRDANKRNRSLISKFCFAALMRDKFKHQKSAVK